MGFPFGPDRLRQAVRCWVEGTAGVAGHMIPALQRATRKTIDRERKL